MIDAGTAAGATLDLDVGMRGTQLVEQAVQRKGLRPRPRCTVSAAGVHMVFRIVAAIALIRLLGFVVFRLLLPLAGRTPPRIVEDLTIIAAYVIYGLAQLRGAGVDLSSIVATSAVITAVLAFAMQDTLGNMLGGLALQLDNSVQVGDWIRVDDTIGRVRDVR